MRRLLIGLTAFLTLTGVFLVLPVYTEPAPEPEPVAAAFEEVAMGSLAEPAPAAEVQPAPDEPATGTGSGSQPTDPAPPVLSVRTTDVDDFSLVGVTWENDPTVTDTVVRVRVRDEDGEWGGWSTVENEAVEAGPNPGEGAPVARGGTEPLWTGTATGVEAELVTRSGTAPTDVQLELIDPGTSPADAALGAPEAKATAEAASGMPAVYSRAQWGADERKMGWDPQYAPTIKAATLHHTDNANGYSSAQVPGIVRAIYSYHAVSRGWGDIGYNVLVDRFGRLWEGRYGGLASTVIGAHAGGFNTGTFGVSMIGDYGEAAVPTPVVVALADIIAWKFSLYGVPARGSTVLTSGGGGTAKYAAGTRVTLPTIFGHRDVGSTSCPGRNGYAMLDPIRNGVSVRLGRLPTIASRYNTEPAVRSLLGTPVGSQQTEAGVTWQVYTRGRMYWSPMGGVHYLIGDNLRKYLAAGGPKALGSPTTDERATPDGVGRYNHFTSGASIYWTPAIRSVLVTGAVRDRWAALGWERSALGYPTADETVDAGGTRYASFEHGVVYRSGSGAYELTGEVRDKFDALGGVAWRGAPLSGAEPASDGTGTLTHFAGATLYESGTAVYAVEGAIRGLWGALGFEASGLGVPTSDELVAPDGVTRYTTFRNGVIYWTPGGGAHAVQGSIERKFRALGGLSWDGGLPVTNERPTPDGIGRYNHFAGSASIYYTPRTGAHVVRGAIRSRWAALGWEVGALGYPTSDELVGADGVTRYTTFQNGVIYWTPGGGAHAVQGSIQRKYAALGGAAWRGLPVTDERGTPDGVGRFNHFAGGASIYYTPQTGAHAVEGAIRARWATLGWERGPLGYPTSDEMVAPGGTSRYTTFQRGTVYWSAGTGAHAVTGSILTRFRALGGPDSALGLPTSDEYDVPGGRRTDFEHGSITWDAATYALTVVQE